MDGFKKRGSAVINITEWIKGKKGLNIIIAIGLIGILLIGLSSFWPDGKKDKSSQTKSSKTAEEFIEETEKKLTEIVGSIEGRVIAV